MGKRKNPGRSEDAHYFTKEAKAFLTSPGGMSYARAVREQPWLAAFLDCPDSTFRRLGKVLLMEELTAAANPEGELLMMESIRAEDRNGGKARRGRPRKAAIDKAQYWCTAKNAAPCSACGRIIGVRDCPSHSVLHGTVRKHTDLRTQLFCKGSGYPPRHPDES